MVHLDSADLEQALERSLRQFGQGVAKCFETWLRCKWLYEVLLDSLHEVDFDLQRAILGLLCLESGAALLVE